MTKSKAPKPKLTADEKEAYVTKIASNVEEIRRLATEARAMSEKIDVPFVPPADILSVEAAETENSDYYEDSGCAWDDSGCTM